MRKTYAPVDGQPLLRDIVKLTVSADHRIIYGATVARFLVAEVDSTGSGVTVYLRDARYARTSRGGWAVVVVTLSGE